MGDFGRMDQPKISVFSPPRVQQRPEFISPARLRRPRTQPDVLPTFDDEAHQPTKSCTPAFHVHTVAEEEHVECDENVGEDVGKFAPAVLESRSALWTRAQEMLKMFEETSGESASDSKLEITSQLKGLLDLHRHCGMMFGFLIIAL
jgi:hypothetical protein